MGGIVGGALDLLKEKEITVRRVLAGTYLVGLASSSSCLRP